MRSDGTIKLDLRRQFISTSLADQLVGLHYIYERYVRVVFADLVLGLIDNRDQNVNPRYGEKHILGGWRAQVFDLASACTHRRDVAKMHACSEALRLALVGAAPAVSSRTAR